MSSLLTVMTDYPSSIARSGATPRRRRKIKRSVATINQMKESVALKNRRQIDAKSTPNRCYGIIANQKLTSKPAPNRRQIDAKLTKSENRKHPIVKICIASDNTNAELEP